MSVHEKLPHGDAGRIVNSFVDVHHKDAIIWQREFRQRLYRVKKKLPFVKQVVVVVHIITIYRRILTEVGLLCFFNPLLTRTNFSFFYLLL